MKTPAWAGERRIAVEYPAEGSIFPPDMEPPTFVWRDPDSPSAFWVFEVKGLRVRVQGQRMTAGDIDPRCVAPTNKAPELTAAQAAAHTWKPDAGTWAAMKSACSQAGATIGITGYKDASAVSRGEVSIRISADPVGAPIFYRDVPLMPAQTEKGEIQPLAPNAIPLVAWRLRDVGEPRSRVLMQGLHTCANCHSFSRDGSTMGMDLDGPQNDKGLYAIVPVKERMSITNQDLISWKTFRSQTANGKRIGFMSQVSPDGEYVVTTTQVSYYVENFKDYRFLQVFYPTRGILACYSRRDGRIRPLPGADDPRYVQTDAVWSPDGKYIVFARAKAKDPYPPGSKPAVFANDPNETPIQYDLYRIPFNDGRGGEATPIAGASRNGMSNSFPKISPDRRWIVFVKSRNGQLMRPDGRLYIVPADGGEAREMQCNTPLMNSWHSFSPNGRWMVFSSKSRSPYTQMFLTHIDEQGNDSPAILIENSTAANRAVNIPEFVNVRPGGIAKIDAPATEFYRLYDRAWELTQKGQTEAAIAAWKDALALDPRDAKARNNYAALLLHEGKLEEAAAEFRGAVADKPGFTDARNNLGLILYAQGKFDEAIAQWRASLEVNPNSGQVRASLGNALVAEKRYADAAAEWHAALRTEPNLAPVLTNLAWLLATCPDGRVRNGAEAVRLAERAARMAEDAVVLDTLAAAYAEAGRFAEAVGTARRAEALADKGLAADIRRRLALYESGKAFRKTK